MDKMGNERFWACQIWLNKSVTGLEIEGRNETGFWQSTLKQELSTAVGRGAALTPWEEEVGESAQRGDQVWRESSCVELSRTRTPCLSHFLPGGWRSYQATHSHPSCHLFSLIHDTEPIAADFLQQLLLPASRPIGKRLKVKRVPAYELCPADFQGKHESPETSWWKALQLKWCASVPRPCLELGLYVDV